MTKISSIQESGFEDYYVPKECKDPEHEPPTHLHVPQGKRYSHVCKSCGKVVVLYPQDISL